MGIWRVIGHAPGRPDSPNVQRHAVLNFNTLCGIGGTDASLPRSCPQGRVQLRNPFLFFPLSISDLMDIFCAVGTVKQTEQPNYLAEGQIPL
eukprot:1157550-Pelagomonas_calceolata.AAC.10